MRYLLSFAFWMAPVSHSSRFPPWSALLLLLSAALLPPALAAGFRDFRALSMSGRPFRGGISSHPHGGSFGASPRLLDALRMNATGIVQPIQISKERLAKDLGLPLRDLRIVDASFHGQVQVSLAARPTAILISLEKLKVVIKNGEAYVFDLDHQNTIDFLAHVHSQLKGGDGAAPEPSAKRFELILLESALYVASQSLIAQVKELSPAVTNALRHLQAESKGVGVLETQMDSLLPLKNKLDEIKTRVKDTKRAIQDIIDEDHLIEMISDLSISKNKNPSVLLGGAESSGSGDAGSRDAASVALSPGSSEEEEDAEHTNIEMLLDNYLTEVEWVEAEVDDVIDEVRNTEENVILQLDLLRNRFLKLELVLSFSSIIVAMGALITGVFGMNLLNHFELSRTAFLAVTGSIFAGMLISFISALMYGRRQKLF